MHQMVLDSRLINDVHLRGEFPLKGMRAERAHGDRQKRRKSAGRKNLPHYKTSFLPGPNPRPLPYFVSLRSQGRGER